MVSTRRAVWLAAIFIGLAASAVRAQDTTLQLTVQNGQFQPSQLRAPVNTAVVIVIRNNDGKPVEFESSSLKVEKVIPAKGQASVRIRPLAPGSYDFYDDFNAANRGTLVVQ